MLDRLPRIWRHLLIQTIAVLLAWAGSDLVPWLRDRPDGWAAIAGVVLGQLLLIVTPLVRYLEPLDDQGDRGDSGTTRTMFAALVGFALAGALVVATLLAGPAEARQRAPRVTAARVCHGGVTIYLDFHGRRDVGVTDVQGLYLGAAAGPGGRWEPLATIGSEGARLWRITGRGVPRKVRAVDTLSGAVSRGVEPVWGCAA